MKVFTGLSYRLLCIGYMRPMQKSRVEIARAHALILGRNDIICLPVTKVVCFRSIFNIRTVSTLTGNFSKETHSMPQSPDLSSYRRYFPSLDLEVNDEQPIYFDNPAVTQVSQQALDAMV